MIADGRIAGVGCYSWRASETISAAGLVVMPGLIDAHMHLESTLLDPGRAGAVDRADGDHGGDLRLARSRQRAGCCGDRHAGRGQRGPAAGPVLHGVVVRARDGLGRRGAALGPDEVRRLLSRPHVLGLAEVMDIPAVLAGGAGGAGKGAGGPVRPGASVDGHAAGLLGRELIAYAAAGIRSDHESTTVEEARARAALGMLVQVREGSSAQNLDALLPLLAGGELDESWCLVTDDIFPSDLQRHGHLDGLLRRLVAGGVPPAVAVRHASYVPARHYGLVDRGAVAPGYRADLVLVEDLESFRVHTVIKDGRVAARDGQCLEHGPARSSDSREYRPPAPARRSSIPPALLAETCPVIEIVPDQIVTRRSVAQRAPARRPLGVRSRARRPADRQHRAAPGLGPDRPGTGQRLRADARRRAGFVGRARFAQPDHRRNQSPPTCSPVRACWPSTAAASSPLPAGHVQAILPLPVAGLALARKRRDGLPPARRGQPASPARLGCPLEAPFGTLSFLALPVIPELRITTQGVFDVPEQEFIKL